MTWLIKATIHKSTISGIALGCNMLYNITMVIFYNILVATAESSGKNLNIRAASKALYRSVILSCFTFSVKWSPSSDTSSFRLLSCYSQSLIVVDASHQS